MLDSVAVRDFVSDQLLSWPQPDNLRTFDNFEPVPGSRIVIEALKQVVFSAGRRAACSPIHIFGETGAGKTHLLNALAGELKDGGVPYVHLDGRILKSAERIASYDLGFRARDSLLEASVAIVDNVHDLDGLKCAGAIQAALADLADAKFQVVLASDFPAECLSGLLPSFANSLQGGLELKIARRGVVEPEVVVLTPAAILKAVSIYYRVSIVELKGRRRTAQVSNARHVAMYLLRILGVQLSFPEIGRLLGNRDHTTVMHGVGRIEKLLESSHGVAQEIALIRRSLLRSMG
ncbi:chromosomal replication initiation ATPase DnaA [Bradyrhizobium sp. USDA 4341]